MKFAFIFASLVLTTAFDSANAVERMLRYESARIVDIRNCVVSDRANALKKIPADSVLKEFEEDLIETNLPDDRCWGIVLSKVKDFGNILVYPIWAPDEAKEAKDFFDIYIQRDNIRKKKEGDYQEELVAEVQRLSRVDDKTRPLSEFTFIDSDKDEVRLACVVISGATTKRIKYENMTQVKESTASFYIYPPELNCGPAYRGSISRQWPEY